MSLIKCNQVAVSVNNNNNVAAINHQVCKMLNYLVPEGVRSHARNVSLPGNPNVFLTKC